LMRFYMTHDETDPPKSKSKVRGRPFQKGNPGRPKGALNKTTQVFRAILADKGEDIMKILLGMVKDRNPTAIRLAVTRLVPPQREDYVQLDLVRVSSPATARAALSQLVEAVANGEITTGQASEMGLLIDRFMKGPIDDWEIETTDVTDEPQPETKDEK
jgi:hypothetical protein